MYYTNTCRGRQRPGDVLIYSVIQGRLNYLILIFGQAKSERLLF